MNIIYGRHPVIDALKAGTQLDKIFMLQSIRGDFEKEVRQLASQYGIPLRVVPKDRLDRLTKGNHQGIIAMVSLVAYYRLEDVLPMIFEQSETPLIILLDGVTDVRNMGAIARSAECSGAHALVIAQKGSAQINAEAMKTSAGALNKIPVCREKSIVGAVEFLQLSGIRVLASDLQADQLLYDLDLTQPLAIVLGSEDAGVSSAVRKKADETFIIPQKGTTDSFNVSVAAGIMLYEVLRQRSA